MQNIVKAIPLGLDSVWKALPGVLNACLIFCVFSTSSASLFTASRILFTLTRDISRNHKYLKRVLSLGKLTPSSNVSTATLIISIITFSWISFLYAATTYNNYDVNALPITEILMLIYDPDIRYNNRHNNRSSATYLVIALYSFHSISQMVGKPLFHSTVQTHQVLILCTRLQKWDSKLVNDYSEYDY